ncbi:MAG: MarR family transcriptional regulator [Firmicutes bacterium]|nr:MarR family transcriptional regulator [Bacillota bacterium]
MNYNTGNALDEKFNALLFQIMRLHYIRVHNLMSQLGLSRGQPPILKLLWEKDGRCQRELGEILHLRPATISVILRRMEKSGLVKRQADPNDRRVSRSYLTQKGREIQSAVEQALQVLEDECCQGFAPEEKTLLSHFLLRIRNNLLQANNGPAWQ